MPREIFAVGPENLPLVPAQLKPHRASYARNFHVLMVSRGEDKRISPRIFSGP
jgi:hypothetical protein